MLTLFTYNQCKDLDRKLQLLTEPPITSSWGLFLGPLAPATTHPPRGFDVVTDPSMLSSPGFEEAARLVLPVLGHSEQLLQACHGFLHGRVSFQADPLVDELPHGLQGQRGRLGAGLLRPLQPARLLQPHPQAGQLGQLHVKVETDVQQALDLGDAGSFVRQDLLAVLLEVFDAIQEFLIKIYRRLNPNL